MKRKVKSVKFTEPETIPGWWDRTWLMATTSGAKGEKSTFPEGAHIRIIRERDYQKLLKLARGK